MPPKSILEKLPQLELEINEDDLSGEWSKQPMLTLNWSTHCADAMFEYDRSKAELELAKAKADAEIRDNPEKFGLSKTTEKVIENAVLQHSEVQKKVKANVTAKYNLNVLQGVVSAIEDRRRALQKKVDLHMTNYYSDAPFPSRVRERRKSDDD